MQHEVQRLCPEVRSTGSTRTLGTCRWKRSAPRAAPLGRKSLLSPADMTRLSEHIVRVTDVLCLSAVTIRGLVLEWLDAEGLDIRPGRQLGEAAPAWHALELQEACQVRERQP